MVDLKLKLPDDFYKEETKCGYTIPAKMKEVWAVQLDLLAEFQRVCDKHSLQFFADGGTLIGTIRHKGFIPWDDDIDVIMMRDQYNKLLQYIDEFTEPYFFQTEYTDPGSMRGHAQLRNSQTTAILPCEANCHFNQGIFMDIFVMDNVPDEDKVLQRQIKLIKKHKMRTGIYSAFNSRYMPAKKKTHRMIKAILHFLFGKFAQKMEVNCFRKMETVCCKYNAKNTNRVGCIEFNLGGEKYLWDRNWYASSVMMPFECLSIPVPVGYDARLKKQYGDYMICKCSPNAHGDVLFDTSKSYKTYLR